MGFQFNNVGGGTKTRRPIALRMQHDPTATTPETMMRALTCDDDPAPTDADMFDLCVLLADIVIGKERE